MVKQLAHGADPFLKNQEGQAPIDLASAEDVRSLLQDAMAAHPSPSCPAPAPAPAPIMPPEAETIIMPSGASLALSTPVPPAAATGASASTDVVVDVAATPDVTTLGGFLSKLVVLYFIIFVPLLHYCQVRLWIIMCGFSLI